MRIIITTVTVPFISGGAEQMASELERALREAGHRVQTIALPFSWLPAQRILDSMLACRLVDLTMSNGVPIDRMIALKFPAYLIPHPNKVVWLLHQHRSAYDLWDHPLYGDLRLEPDGRAVREAIRAADTALLPEAQALFSDSRTVADRLRRYNGISSEILYHPPPRAEDYYSSSSDPFLFFPSRLVASKRQDLILRALSHTREDVRVVFAGPPDTPGIERSLRTLTAELGIESRVSWLGSISHEDKLAYFARCRGIVYVPVDEDYGYVSLEAMCASKPVLSCTDSGGANELLRDRSTGRIVEPEPRALARAMDEMIGDTQLCERWGAAARQKYDSLGLTWSNVVTRLTS